MVLPAIARRIRWPAIPPPHERRGFSILVVLAVLLAVGSAASGAPAVFPVEDVRPGLKGYGLTVVEGTRIDRFDVDVLGLVRGAGPAGDLVLVRVSGPVVEAFGGIAAGMSGSPVYVDGKLLGAIGFAFEFSDHSVGFVTPIGDMLKVLERLQVAATPATDEPASGRFQRVAFARDGAEAGEMVAALPPDTAVMVPVRTPVMLSGFGPRTQEAVRRLLSPYRLLFVPGGGTVGAAGASGSTLLGPAAPQLEPGSAFGVSLVRGDVELTAIGTVTYVEGDRFIGFGHPFLQKGTVDFFAGPAYIHRTVSSLNVPFKLGSMLGVTGKLSEDRRAAVGGRVGLLPGAIDLSVAVEDLSSGHSRTLQAQVVRDDMLTVPLVAISALEALDRGLDRIGPGTARIIYRVAGRKLPGSGVFSRDNMYFSRLDISARMLGDFLDALQMLSSNRFQDVEVQSVELRVQVDQAQRTAAIVKARPLKKSAAPGERVGIEVELLPYRSEKEVRVLTIQVPEDASPGTVSVTVRGGSGATFSLSPELQSLLLGEEQPSPGEEQPAPDTGEQEVPGSLEKLLEFLESREKSNQLVAEFYPGLTGTAGSSDTSQQDPTSAGRTGRLPGEDSAHKGTASKAGSELGETGAVKSTLITPWVIEGSTTFDLEIKEAPGNPAPSEETTEPPGGQP